MARIFAWALALLFVAASGGQPAGQGATDYGVAPTLLMDREEIRVYRVVLEPGAVRSVHSHDDVDYHVWVPLEGTMELSLGAEPPVSAEPGDSFFVEAGTMHGWRNVGTTPAEVMEIFVYE